MMRFLHMVGVLIIMLFYGCGAPKDITGERQIAEQFLLNVQSHQFERAFELLSPEAKANATWQGLGQGIQSMEAENGLIKKWELLRHSVSVGTPPYVILDYQLQGERKNMSAIFRISEGNRGLQIDKVDFDD